MFIELVDTLRCPVTHEESWLVLSTRVVEARHVREGTLGCPVCLAEYPIVDGVADLRTVRGAVEDVRPAEQVNRLADADALAAMMDLGDPSGFAVLIGRWCERASQLLEQSSCPPLVLVDPPNGVQMQPGLSGVRCDAAIPLAAGAARSIASDAIDVERNRSAAHATRVGGRMVAPGDATVPPGVRELARDERLWVGEREPLPSAPITLHVRRGV